MEMSKFVFKSNLSEYFTNHPPDWDACEQVTIPAAFVCNLVSHFPPEKLAEMEFVDLPLRQALDHPVMHRGVLPYAELHGKLKRLITDCMYWHRLSKPIFILNDGNRFPDTISAMAFANLHFWYPHRLIADTLTTGSYQVSVLIDVLTGHVWQYVPRVSPVSGDDPSLSEYTLLPEYYWLPPIPGVKRK